MDQILNVAEMSIHESLVIASFLVSPEKLTRNSGYTFTMYQDKLCQSRV